MRSTVSPGTGTYQRTTPIEAPATRPLTPSAPERLRYLRPELPPLSDMARYHALSEEQHWYSNRGRCYERFAALLADYIGDVRCVPVSSCTLG